MTDSLRELIPLLGSSRVSGMAQAVGLHWPPPPPISVRDLVKRAFTALVLSGGGAKGSFEVGAIKYLYGIGVRPRILCTTSVGSTNGLKLAEGERGPGRGFDGLEDIWLNMKANSDMFVENSWFKKTPTWIKDAVAGTGSDSGWFESLIQNLILIFVPGVSALKLRDLRDFAKTAQIAHGIYNLSPIEKLAHKKINLALLGDIRLRMAAVGLKSGQIRYISEKGRLLADPALPSDHSGSPKVDIIKGMLASAAIPVFFEMQHLAGDWYVDGGIRQVATVSAAVTMGAKEVFAIVAPVPLAPDDDYTHKGLMDIGFRAATDITLDEILTDNIAPFNGWPVPVHVIRPNIEIESSRTIDRGLIRINMAYGFMRAFDIVSPVATRNPAKQDALIKLSDKIVSTRLEIWQKEESAWFNWGNVDAEGPGQRGDPCTMFISNVNDMRALKSALLGLVECRLGIAGQESMPADARNWAASWEAHWWDPTNLPGSPDFPNSPWDEFRGHCGMPEGLLQATPPPGGCPQFPQ